MIFEDPVEAKIYHAITPALEVLGYEVVRVLYTKINGLDTLQVMIDSINEKEIVVEDCEIASKQVSAILDVEDPIQDKYNLELSSPGIDRPLTRLKDFVKHINYEIKLRAIEKIENRQRFSGVILAVQDSVITIELAKDENIDIKFENIKSAKLILTEKLLNKANI